MRRAPVTLSTALQRAILAGAALRRPGERVLRLTVRYGPYGEQRARLIVGPYDDHPDRPGALIGRVHVAPGELWLKIGCTARPLAWWTGRGGAPFLRGHLHHRTPTAQRRLRRDLRALVALAPALFPDFNLGTGAALPTPPDRSPVPLRPEMTP